MKKKLVLTAILIIAVLLVISIAFANNPGNKKKGQPKPGPGGGQNTGNNTTNIAYFCWGPPSICPPWADYRDCLGIMDAPRGPVYAECFTGVEPGSVAMFFPREVEIEEDIDIESCIAYSFKPDLEPPACDDAEAAVGIDPEEPGGYREWVLTYYEPYIDDPDTQEIALAVTRTWENTFTLTPSTGDYSGVCSENQGIVASEEYHVYLPIDEMFDERHTTLHIQNLDIEPASAELRFYPKDDFIAAPQTCEINFISEGHAMPYDPRACLNIDDFIGHVEIVSEQEIGAIADIAFSDGTGLTFRGLYSEQKDTQYFIEYIPADWEAEIIIINPNPVPARVEARFVDASANAINIEVIVINAFSSERVTSTYILDKPTRAIINSMYYNEYEPQPIFAYAELSYEEPVIMNDQYVIPGNKKAGQNGVDKKNKQNANAIAAPLLANGAQLSYVGGEEMCSSMQPDGNVLADVDAYYYGPSAGMYIGTFAMNGDEFWACDVETGEGCSEKLVDVIEFTLEYNEIVEIDFGEILTENAQQLYSFSDETFTTSETYNKKKATVTNNDNCNKYKMQVQIYEPHNPDSNGFFSAMFIGTAIPEAQRCEGGDGPIVMDNGEHMTYSVVIEDENTGECKGNCGNNVTETQYGEECDDGKDGDNTDECTDECKHTYCGDGMTQDPNGKQQLGKTGVGDEECDPGFGFGEDSPYALPPHIPEGAECPPGTHFVVEKKCNDNCTLNCAPDMPTYLCGDGVQDPGEECDDGCKEGEEPDGCDGFPLNNDDTCDENCSLTKCGDGIIQSPNGYGQEENCDDGNNESGDGCSSVCKTEECGDGTVQEHLGEICDPPGSQTENLCLGYDDVYETCSEDCTAWECPSPPTEPSGPRGGRGGTPVVYDIIEEEVYIPSPPPVIIEEGCFLAGTKILMADESYKNIEDVAVGDRVMSFDETAVELKPGIVTETFVHENISGYLIINNKLKVTSNHPLFVNNEWKNAGDANIGDYLLNKDNKPLLIESVEYVDEIVTVYNFDVEKIDTYYAEDNYLVHNQDETIYTGEDLFPGAAQPQSQPQPTGYVTEEIISGPKPQQDHDHFYVEPPEEPDYDEIAPEVDIGEPQKPKDTHPLISEIALTVAEKEPFTQTDLKFSDNFFETLQAISGADIERKIDSIKEAAEDEPLVLSALDSYDRLCVYSDEITSAGIVTIPSEFIQRTNLVIEELETAMARLEEKDKEKKRFLIVKEQEGQSIFNIAGIFGFAVAESEEEEVETEIVEMGLIGQEPIVIQPPEPEPVGGEVDPGVTLLEEIKIVPAEEEKLDEDEIMQFIGDAQELPVKRRGIPHLGGRVALAEILDSLKGQSLTAEEIISIFEEEWQNKLGDELPEDLENELKKILADIKPVPAEEIGITPVEERPVLADMFVNFIDAIGLGAEAGEISHECIDYEEDKRPYTYKPGYVEFNGVAYADRCIFKSDNGTIQYLDYCPPGVCSIEEYYCDNDNLASFDFYCGIDKLCKEGACVSLIDLFDIEDEEIKMIYISLYTEKALLEKLVDILEAEPELEGIEVDIGKQKEANKILIDYFISNCQLDVLRSEAGRETRQEAIEEELEKPKVKPEFLDIPYTQKGEFIEIFNPANKVFDISNYCLSDAVYRDETGKTFAYYHLPQYLKDPNSSMVGGDFGDFIACFPEGSELEPKETAIIFIAGSEGFFEVYENYFEEKDLSEYKMFELFEDNLDSDNIPDMVEPFPGSIPLKPIASLDNFGESIILFELNYEEGVLSDLVTDIDYVGWDVDIEYDGAIDKTGICIDGPDADEEESCYKRDTPYFKPSSAEFSSGECWADEDCGPDGICDIANHLCKIRCDKDEDCPDNMSCEDSMCTARESGEEELEEALEEEVGEEETGEIGVGIIPENTAGRESGEEQGIPKIAGHAVFKPDKPDKPFNPLLIVLIFSIVLVILTFVYGNKSRLLRKILLSNRYKIAIGIFLSLIIITTSFPLNASALEPDDLEKEQIDSLDKFALENLDIAPYSTPIDEVSEEDINNLLGHFIDYIIADMVELGELDYPLPTLLHIPAQEAAFTGRLEEAVNKIGEAHELDTAYVNEAEEEFTQEKLNPDNYMSDDIIREEINERKNLDESKTAQDIEDTLTDEPEFDKKYGPGKRQIFIPIQVIEPPAEETKTFYEYPYDIFSSGLLAMGSEQMLLPERDGTADDFEYPPAIENELEEQEQSNSLKVQEEDLTGLSDETMSPEDILDEDKQDSHQRIWQENNPSACDSLETAELRRPESEEDEGANGLVLDEEEGAHDETSEDLSQSFVFANSNPGDFMCIDNIGQGSGGGADPNFINYQQASEYFNNIQENVWEKLKSNVEVMDNFTNEVPRNKNEADKTIEILKNPPHPPGVANKDYNPLDAYKNKANSIVWQQKPTIKRYTNDMIEVYNDLASIVIQKIYDPTGENTEKEIEALEKEQEDINDKLNRVLGDGYAEAKEAEEAWKKGIRPDEKPGRIADYYKERSKSESDFVKMFVDENGIPNKDIPDFISLLHGLTPEEKEAISKIGEERANEILSQLRKEKELYDNHINSKANLNPPNVAGFNAHDIIEEERDKAQEEYDELAAGINNTPVEDLAKQGLGIYESEYNRQQARHTKISNELKEINQQLANPQGLSQMQIDNFKRKKARLEPLEKEALTDMEKAKAEYEEAQKKSPEELAEKAEQEMLKQSQERLGEKQKELDKAKQKSAVELGEEYKKKLENRQKEIKAALERKKADIEKIKKLTTKDFIKDVKELRENLEKKIHVTSEEAKEQAEEVGGVNGMGGKAFDKYVGDYPEAFNLDPGEEHIYKKKEEVKEEEKEEEEESPLPPDEFGGPSPLGFAINAEDNGEEQEENKKAQQQQPVKTGGNFRDYIQDSTKESVKNHKEGSDRRYTSDLIILDLLEAKQKCDKQGCDSWENTGNPKLKNKGWKAEAEFWIFALEYLDMYIQSGTYYINSIHEDINVQNDFFDAFILLERVPDPGFRTVDYVKILQIKDKIDADKFTPPSPPKASPEPDKKSIQVRTGPATAQERLIEANQKITDLQKKQGITYKQERRLIKGPEGQETFVEKRGRIWVEDEKYKDPNAINFDHDKFKEVSENVKNAGDELKSAKENLDGLAENVENLKEEFDNKRYEENNIDVKGEWKFVDGERVYVDESKNGQVHKQYTQAEGFERVEVTSEETTPEGEILRKGHIVKTDPYTGEEYQVAVTEMEDGTWIEDQPMFRIISRVDGETVDYSALVNHYWGEEGLLRGAVNDFNNYRATAFKGAADNYNKATKEWTEFFDSMGLSGKIRQLENGMMVALDKSGKKVLILSDGSMYFTTEEKIGDRVIRHYYPYNNKEGDIPDVEVYFDLDENGNIVPKQVIDISGIPDEKMELLREAGLYVGDELVDIVIVDGQVKVISKGKSTSSFHSFEQRYGPPSLVEEGEYAEFKRALRGWLGFPSYGITEADVMKILDKGLSGLDSRGNYIEIIPTKLASGEIGFELSVTPLTDIELGADEEEYIKALEDIEKAKRDILIENIYDLSEEERTKLEDDLTKRINEASAKDPNNLIDLMEEGFQMTFFKQSLTAAREFAKRKIDSSLYIKLRDKLKVMLAEFKQRHDSISILVRFEIIEVLEELEKTIAGRGDELRRLLEDSDNIPDVKSILNDAYSLGHFDVVKDAAYKAYDLYKDKDRQYEGMAYIKSIGEKLFEDDRENFFAGVATPEDMAGALKSIADLYDRAFKDESSFGKFIKNNALMQKFTSGTFNPDDYVEISWGLEGEFVGYVNDKAFTDTIYALEKAQKNANTPQEKAQFSLLINLVNQKKDLLKNYAEAKSSLKGNEDNLTTWLSVKSTVAQVPVFGGITAGLLGFGDAPQEKARLEDAVSQGKAVLSVLKARMALTDEILNIKFVEIQRLDEDSKSYLWKHIGMKSRILGESEKARQSNLFTAAFGGGYEDMQQFNDKLNEDRMRLAAWQAEMIRIDPAYGDKLVNGNLEEHFENMIKRGIDNERGFTYPVFGFKLDVVGISGFLSGRGDSLDFQASMTRNDELISEQIFSTLYSAQLTAKNEGITQEEILNEMYKKKGQVRAEFEQEVKDYIGEYSFWDEGEPLVEKKRAAYGVLDMFAASKYQDARIIGSFLGSNKASGSQESIDGFNNLKAQWADLTADYHEYQMQACDEQNSFWSDRKDMFGNIRNWGIPGVSQFIDFMYGYNDKYETARGQTENLISELRDSANGYRGVIGTGESAFVFDSLINAYGGFEYLTNPEKGVWNEFLNWESEGKLFGFLPMSHSAMSQLSSVGTIIDFAAMGPIFQGITAGLKSIGKGIESLLGKVSSKAAAGYTKTMSWIGKNIIEKGVGKPFQWSDGLQRKIVAFTDDIGSNLIAKGYKFSGKAIQFGGNKFGFLLTEVYIEEGVINTGFAILPIPGLSGDNAEMLYGLSLARGSAAKIYIKEISGVDVKVKNSMAIDIQSAIDNMGMSLDVANLMKSGIFGVLSVESTEELNKVKGALEQQGANVQEITIDSRLAGYSIIDTAGNAHVLTLEGKQLHKSLMQNRFLKGNKIITEEGMAVVMRVTHSMDFTQMNTQFFEQNNLAKPKIDPATGKLQSNPEEGVKVSKNFIKTINKGVPEGQPGRVVIIQRAGSISSDMRVEIGVNQLSVVDIQMMEMMSIGLNLENELKDRFRYTYKVGKVQKMPILHTDSKNYWMIQQETLNDTAN